MAELITTNELCDALKVSRTTVETWRKEGMPYEKLGRIVRFDKDKVMEWLRTEKSKK